jgi:glycosyltransferase involved in cell wall biosynthesis
MRITWLISGQVTGRTPAEWDCPLASVRYRVLAPARWLVNEGHVCNWLLLSELERTDPESRQRVSALLGADVVVISKVLAGGSVAALERAASAGAQVVVDLCDDHFDTPELSATYFELCNQADMLTASTTTMAEVIRDRTGRKAAIIDDPFEGPLGHPHFCPRVLSNEVRLAWFGHPVNFDTILAMLPGLKSLSRELPLELHVVTDLNAAKQSPLLAELQRAVDQRLQLRLTPWSLQATWQALAQCDLVVIPSLPSAKKLVKSPNRVVEGIRSGRLVLAYPLPAHQELAPGLWLGDDMAAGIRAALADPRAALETIIAGQSIIARRFSPQRIAQRWEAVLEQLAECPA